MQATALVHLKVIHRVLKYCVTTPERRLILKPNQTWNGKQDVKLIVKGLSDANYATNPSSRLSVPRRRADIYEEGPAKEHHSFNRRSRIGVWYTVCIRHYFCDVSHGVNWTESQEAHDTAY
jgi:hypothetical protein